MPHVAINCAFCAGQIQRGNEVYFLACRMDAMKSLIKLCVYPTPDTEHISEMRQKPCCMDCAVDKTETVRTTAVINPHLWTPEILDVYEKTQVELLRTILPDYDSQTQTLVETRDERLSFLLSRRIFSADQKNEIRNLIGNSPNNG